MLRSLSKYGVLAIIAAAGLVALGARCVENTSVYVDSEGYTHLTGEMYNETDIQGAALMLRGTLYDAAGNIIAEKDAPICPPDLQPNSKVMFDIRFDNPGIPTPATHSVRAVAGKALESPLPPPEVGVMRTDAIRFIGFPSFPEFPVTDRDVFFRFAVRNRSDGVLVGVQGCSAAFNNQGKIIAADAGELFQFDEDGIPYTAVLSNEFPVTVFMQLSDVPPEAAYVRGWLWFGDAADGTSAYQFIMTPNITIQTDTFP